MLKSVFIFLLSTGAIFLAFSGQNFLSPIIPELINYFSIDYIQVTIISSSFFYTYVIFQIPAGILVDLYGARRCLLISFSLYLLAVIWFVLAENYISAILSRMLLGIASAPAASCSLYIAARWLSKKLFSFAVGSMETIAIIGAAISQTILIYSLNFSYGWRAGMFCFSLLSGVFFILIYLFVKDDPTLLIRKSIKKSYSLKFMFKKNILLNGIYSGLCFSTISGFTSYWLIPYLATLYTELDRQSIVHLSSTTFIGTAIGAPLIGFIFNLNIKRQLVMIVCSFVSTVLLMLVIYYPPNNYNLMILYLFLLGIFVGAYIIPFIVIKESVSSNQLGISMGFANTMSIIIGAPIIQPLISNLLYYISSDGSFTLHDYRQALFIVPVCMILSIITVLFMDKDELSSN